MVAAYEPNEIDRVKIEACAVHGIPHDMIAAHVGISINTMKKYYGRLLESAKLNRVMEVSNALYMTAIKGNVTAQIFFLKTQARWKDDSKLEVEVTEDNQVKTIQIEVIKGKSDGLAA